MAQGQDAAIDQAIRDYFREALDWGQEFADIFAPDAEVDVDDCISTLETRLSDHRRRLAVRNFPSDVHADAEALVGAIPPEQLTSRYLALQRAHAGLMRAKIETDRLLITKLNGDYSQTAIADPLFAGVEPRLDETIPSHVISHPQAPTQALSTAPSLDDLAKAYEQVLEAHGLKSKTLGDLKLSLDLARAVIDFDKPASLLDINDMKALRDIVGHIPAHYLNRPGFTGG